MVATIVPAVFAGRRKKWYIAAVIFIIAGIVGGTLAGLILGTVGTFLNQVLPDARESLLLFLPTIIFGYAMYELGLIRLPILPIRRQVQRGLRNRLPITIVSFIYGIQLGAGLVTRVTTASLYVVCIGTIAIGAPLTGAIIMALFGLARSAFTLVASYKLMSMEMAFSEAVSLAKWQPSIKVADALILITTGVALSIQYVIHGT